MAGGRNLKELILFSPIKSALFRREYLGPSNHIFTGVALFVLLGFGYFAFSLGFRDGKSAKRLKTCLLAGLLTLAIVAIVLLALGTYGPWGALPIRTARTFIPKYRMIRQPMKIFCILPPILCVLLSLLYRRIASAHIIVRFATVLFAIATVGEQVFWLHTGLCELPESFPAYANAAAYVRAHEQGKPHAVCLPLWPGDSHFSSIYEYGALTSRIRLVNGYAPAVPEDYAEKIFSKLSSLNNGELNEDQRQLLLSIGVNLLLFHEQPYPSKVSPFPSGVALRLLRGNPALREIACGDGGFAVAFTVEKADPGRGYGGTPPDTCFPASYHWPMSRLTDRGREPGHARTYQTRLRPPVPVAPGLCSRMLLSGRGKLQGDCGHEIKVPAKPRWVSVPFTDPMGENFRVVDGDPVAHHAFIAAGANTTFNPACSNFVWRASDLFHFGHSSDDVSNAMAKADGVTFNTKRNPAGMMLYGPDLPFPKGLYTATITGRFAPGDAFVVSTIGDGGRRLALAKLQDAGGDAATSTSLTFRSDGLAPLRLEYHYAACGDACVERLELRRGK
jgi:hypothetical protein